MPNRCMATKKVLGTFLECWEFEFHKGKCKFVTPEMAVLVWAARNADAVESCSGCGSDGHAKRDCSEKVGGTNAE